jgi:hypothetical protein
MMRRAFLSLVAVLATLAAAPSLAADEPTDEPAPTAKDWADLAKLPDWSGIWNPDVRDQFKQAVTNPPPWTPASAAKVAEMNNEERAGNPRGLFLNCLPEGMPSWMLISHNALEFLFTPGRVTLLGESDGSRLRRIHTDGRPHPEDPDPSFHGDSVGHWEGDTLVVDTIGVYPQTFIATGESVGLPNNGDMHIVERIHLVGPDTLHDDLEITAPHVLSGPWKTTRSFFRQRGRKYDIVEGECLEGSFAQRKDKNGDAIFAPLAQDQGNIVPDPK